VGLLRAWRYNVDLLGYKGTGSSLRFIRTLYVMVVRSVLLSVDISLGRADQVLVRIELCRAMQGIRGRSGAILG
jgi:hypothetical protein